MTHTRPMSCAPHPGTVGQKHRPVEDGAYRMTPAQELDLAVEELRWVMADWLHSRQRRRLREVLRAVESAQRGLA